nr:hypothetical protein [Tanacetum cinerariifolium]
MDPKSSLRNICLGDDVVVILSGKVKGSGDCNSPEYQDTNVSKGNKVVNTLSFYRMETDEISERYIAPCFMNGFEAYDGEVNLEFYEKLISKEYAVKLCLNYEGQLLDFNFDDVPKFGEELPLFICKIGKSNRNKKRTMENFNIFYQDIRPSSSAGRHLTQEEVEKEALAKDQVELDGNTIKEEEDAVKRIKGEALKEKDDPGAFIFSIRLEGKVNKNALADTGSDINTMPYRIYETLGREETKKIDKGITMINHTRAKAMGKLSTVLCQVGVTTIIAKFLILDIPIDHDAPIVTFSTFDGLCHQTFRAARFDVLRTAESDSDDEEEYVIKRNRIIPFQPRKYAGFFAKPPYFSLFPESTPHFRETSGTYDGEAGSSLSKRPRQHKTVEEVLLSQVHHEFLLWEGCSRDAKSNDMLRIRLHEAGSNEEIFTFVAWIRAFNINEPIYAELCHEFYSTYEFDEVCAGDELQSKKIIRFKLGGRAHNLTLLEFAQRLGLYQVTELEEEGFNVYFEGGLRSDEHFNAQDYWLSISREEHLGLSQSHTFTIRNPILRVIYKMITYGLCQRTTGYDKIQKNDLWLLSMFDAKHQNGYANVAWVITKWMKKKGAGT